MNLDIFPPHDYYDLIIPADAKGAIKPACASWACMPTLQIKVWYNPRL